VAEEAEAVVEALLPQLLRRLPEMQTTALS
jgi:hypothetical protein